MVEVWRSSILWMRVALNSELVDMLIMRFVLRANGGWRLVRSGRNFWLVNRIMTGRKGSFKNEENFFNDRTWGNCILARESLYFDKCRSTNKNELRNQLIKRNLMLSSLVYLSAFSKHSNEYHIVQCNDCDIPWFIIFIFSMIYITLLSLNIFNLFIYFPFISVIYLFLYSLSSHLKET